MVREGNSRTEEKDGVMWQCRRCLKYFDHTEKVEIWLNGRPFHRECLKEKAEEEMIEPEPFIEEVENPENTALEFNASVLKIS